MFFIKHYAIFLLVLPLLLSAQTRKIYFEAKSMKDLSDVTIDSIHILNLSNGLDTTIVGTTEFDLNTLTGIRENTRSVTPFAVSRNYPNAFSSATRFQVGLPEQTSLKINVYNILGQRVDSFSNTMTSGIHTFLFEGHQLASGMYFIQISRGGEKKTIKALKIGQGSGRQGKIVYRGASSMFKALAKPARATQEDIYNFTGYATGYLPMILENVAARVFKIYEFVFNNAPEIADLASVWEPIYAGRPPIDAFRGLVRPWPGEVRHYLYAGGSANYYYNASYDDGLSWTAKVTVESDKVGADSKHPDTGEYIRVHSANGSVVTTVRSEGGIDGAWQTLTYDGLINETELIMIKPPVFIEYNNETRIIVGVHGVDRLGAACLFSDDNGETWTLSERVVAPHHEPGGIHLGTRWNHGAVEPTIIPLNEGRLWMLMRTAQDNHYEAYSSDGGATWTEAVPSRFFGTITMPTIGRLSDGRLLFMWSNTTPLPEKARANGVWEDVFTNRDAIHAAISEDDGQNWIGFREVWLNERRNDPSVFALNTYGNDKSVHQAQFVEVGDGKILAAFGQNALMRSMVIFDIDWLYETERSDDFSDGLDNWSVHNYYAGVVGHVAYNRTKGADLVPHPDQPGKQVLRVRNVQTDPPLEVTNQGAVWNFPAGHSGTFTVKFMLQDKSRGAQISLADRWFNPCDTTAHYFTNYTLKLDSTGAFQDENIVTPGTWQELRFEWNGVDIEESADCKLYVNDVLKIDDFPLNNISQNGISYVHFHSPATGIDSSGFLIESVQASTSFDN